MSERNIGANNPILTVLNHPGKPWTRPGEEDENREPTKAERKVQAWRESGKADGPKPTGRARRVWEARGNQYRGDWVDSEIAVRELVEWREEGAPTAWLEYEYTLRESNAENPQEPISLPECGAIGTEMDNVSGGAKTGVESGEIATGWALVDEWHDGELVNVQADRDGWEPWTLAGYVPNGRSIPPWEAQAAGYKLVRVRIVPVEEQG